MNSNPNYDLTINQCKFDCNSILDPKEQQVREQLFRKAHDEWVADMKLRGEWEAYKSTTENKWNGLDMRPACVADGSLLKYQMNLYWATFDALVNK